MSETTGQPQNRLRKFQPDPRNTIFLYGSPCVACGRPALAVFSRVRVVHHMDQNAPYCDITTL